MELGLTFPLQRFLHQRPPPCGSEADRRFCWDLHVIRLRGRNCLLAVHCHSRYAFVRFDMPGLLWADLPGLFRAGLTDSLTAAGFGPAQSEADLQAATDSAVATAEKATGKGIGVSAVGTAAVVGGAAMPAALGIGFIFAAARKRKSKEEDLND